MPWPMRSRTTRVELYSSVTTSGSSTKWQTTSGCDQELRGWSYTRQSRLPAHRPSGKRHLDLREPKGDEVGRRHSWLQEPPQGQGYESGQQGRQIERPGQGCQRRLVEFQKNALQSSDKLEETELNWTLGPTTLLSRQCSCLFSMFSRPPKVDQSIFTLVSQKNTFSRK